jgi:hypothetical protein
MDVLLWGFSVFWQRGALMMPRDRTYQVSVPLGGAIANQVIRLIAPLKIHYSALHSLQAIKSLPTFSPDLAQEGD